MAGKLVCDVRLKLAALEVDDVIVPPLGLMSETVTLPIVLFVTFTVAAWPEFAEKVTLAFCPGTVVVTGKAEPPSDTEPVKSAGTRYNVSVTDPV